VIGEVSCRLEERLRQIIVNKLIFRDSNVYRKPYAALRQTSSNQLNHVGILGIGNAQHSLHSPASFLSPESLAKAGRLSGFAKEFPLWGRPTCRA
jgi:hypothetical protein